MRAKNRFPFIASALLAAGLFLVSASVSQADLFLRKDPEKRGNFSGAVKPYSFGDKKTEDPAAARQRQQQAPVQPRTKAPARPAVTQPSQNRAASQRPAAPSQPAAPGIPSQIPGLEQNADGDFINLTPERLQALTDRLRPEENNNCTDEEARKIAGIVGGLVNLDANLEPNTDTLTEEQAKATDRIYEQMQANQDMMARCTDKAARLMYGAQAGQ